MKRLLLPLLAALAMPTFVYGNDHFDPIDYYIYNLDKHEVMTYGHGYGSAAMICNLYSYGKIKKRIAKDFSSTWLLRHSNKNWPEFFVGWNEGLSSGCEFMKF